MLVHSITFKAWKTSSLLHEEARASTVASLALSQRRHRGRFGKAVTAFGCSFKKTRPLVAMLGTGGSKILLPRTGMQTKGQLAVLSDFSAKSTRVGERDFGPRLCKNQGTYSLPLFSLFFPFLCQ